MLSDRLHLAPEFPEWRRSAPFLLLAIALHAAALFYPVKIAITLFDTPPPNTVIVRLEQATPPRLTEPPRAQPTPAQPASRPQRERPAPTPRPVIAMAPQQTSQPAVFSAPAPAPITAPPATAAVAAPAVSNAPPATVSPARFDAAYLNNPEPKYPPLSRRLGEEGKVLLRVRVSPDGKAAAVDLEKSSNFVRLDEAARQAVAHWRFVPAKRGEEAIETTIIIPLVFRLED